MKFRPLFMLAIIPTALLAACAPPGGSPSPAPPDYPTPFASSQPPPQASSVVPEDLSPHACTLMACEDALTILFEGSVPSAYSVELVETGGESIGFACADGEVVAESYSSSLYGADMTPPGIRWMTTCQADRFEGGPGLFIGSFIPAEVTITITWDQGAVTQTVAPEYTVLQPNGPGCEPICHTATAVIQLGG